ncbi:MAG: undecaprenyl/decaprenyl-phosphate alpha-N-acetylglucosaminyl 1-phosphate transferase [Planctomycetes bacterium]|nr:undecaprenyl/decaprenyl-phosphate alpha-N-acetylglucosaminyl 1-phosphate transferase [Planctomycetota bacterium]
MLHLLITCVGAFAASFATALLITPWVGRVAARIGAVDEPGPRKIHTTPKPCLGGVGLYLACLVPVVASYLLYACGNGFMADAIGEDVAQLWVITVLSGGILLLGVCDDIKGLGVGPKLIVEIGAALLLYSVHIRFSYITNPFGGASIALGWFSPIATVLWVVGVTNAINFLDGVDGLAAGVAAFVGLTLCVGALQAGDVLCAILALSAAGAAIGFLRYNFPPARIFMGDSGALFLGFFLATISLKALLKGTAAVSILLPMVALGVPIWDSLLAVTRRAMDGRSIFSADDGHVHHRLLKRGLSQRQVALTLYGVTVLLCTAAIALMFLRRAEAVLILAILGAFGYVTSRWLGTQLPRLRMTGTFEGNVVDRLAARLANTKDAARRWQVFCSALDVITVVSAEFIPSERDLDLGEMRGKAWRVEGAKAAPLTVPILVDGRRVGRFMLCWTDEREAPRGLRGDMAKQLGELFVEHFGCAGAEAGPIEDSEEHGEEPA